MTGVFWVAEFMVASVILMGLGLELADPCRRLGRGRCQIKIVGFMKAAHHAGGPAPQAPSCRHRGRRFTADSGFFFGSATIV